MSPVAVQLTDEQRAEIAEAFDLFDNGALSPLLKCCKCSLRAAYTSVVRWVWHH